ncbi:SH3 domain-containing kinase-binding protein 1 [Fopius arisanus]|uniref:SH3 domain-containing kinase-binding protein 1 n=2 Tax=Fopius arisanus TaxID=64838 RepID=A0A0C9RU04_9HYME|nr:PREDICTED: SH3 domain-containing kinase-binding protein 1-like [Fopius arisanus]
MEAIVEYNYVAQESDELTLRKGDIIKDIKIIAGGWWEGTLRDKCGMFPDNFVKLLTPSPSGNGTLSKSDTEEVTLRNGSSGRRCCKVLFSYEPCNEDELALVPQDVVEFLGEVEEGWWRGRLRGRTGVFPSNFVTPPTPDDSDRETKELCRVLFPYKASNDDELTLDEGDVVTLLSRDAPDKGWWKGELNGRVGLFPDNFVTVMGSKPDNQQNQDYWQESSQPMGKSGSLKSSHTGKKGEKANVRKSLDSRGTNDNSKKTASSAISSLMSSSSSSMSSTQTNSVTTSDKKSMIMSSLKRMVEKPSDSNVESAESSEGGLGEELDGVERGEGAPLSHLTASRARAPRRRLPSSQHFRNQGGNFTGAVITPPGPTVLDDNGTNGTTDTVDQFREEDNDGVVVGKSRRIAPWIEELKQNQMEKRKVFPPEKPEKIERKKEQRASKPPILSMPSSIPETNIKTGQDNVEARQREKDKDKEKDTSQRPESSHPTCPVSPNTGSTPAYVPYRLYNQLLDRVTALEEKHTVLQRTVAQLSEQLSTSTNKH